MGSWPSDWPPNSDDAPGGGRRGGSGGDWVSEWLGEIHRRANRTGPGSPPPWVSGLLGLVEGRPDPGRGGQKARRGDVRSAILDVLSAGPLNGYQIIQLITERSAGAWKPSPGSVYPTLQQLQDEGLVTGEDDQGRRVVWLSPEGQEWVADHADELAALWAPFEPAGPSSAWAGTDFARLKPELGQLAGALWQVLSHGSETQRAQAIDILGETRRRLYALLAEPESPSESGSESPPESPPESGSESGSADGLPAEDVASGDVADAHDDPDA